MESPLRVPRLNGATLWMKKRNEKFFELMLTAGTEWKRRRLAQIFGWVFQRLDSRLCGKMV